MDNFDPFKTKQKKNILKKLLLKNCVKMSISVKKEEEKKVFGENMNFGKTIVFGENMVFL